MLPRQFQSNPKKRAKIIKQSLNSQQTPANLIEMNTADLNLLEGADELKISSQNQAYNSLRFEDRTGAEQEFRRRRGAESEFHRRRTGASYKWLLY